MTAANTLGEYLRARRELVDSEGRLFDVLAANSMATALSPSIKVGENRLRSMFLDPAEREFYPDWLKAIGGLDGLTGPGTAGVAGLGREHAR